MATYLGVDPGWASGGVVALDDAGEVLGVCRLSKTSRREQFEFFLEFGGPGASAALELVNAMPGQGVASTFKFGRGTGVLEGFLTASGTRYEEVTPAKWQVGLRVPKGAKTERKKHLNSVAEQKFPCAGKIVREICDAFLLADWARCSGAWKR